MHTHKGIKIGNYPYIKKTAKTKRITYIVNDILSKAETGRDDDTVYFFSPQTGTHYQWSLTYFKKHMKKIR